jgi:hypothetical protein
MSCPTRFGDMTWDAFIGMLLVALSIQAQIVLFPNKNTNMVT